MVGVIPDPLSLVCISFLYQRTINIYGGKDMIKCVNPESGFCWNTVDPEYVSPTKFNDIINELKEDTELLQLNWVKLNIKYRRIANKWFMFDSDGDGVEDNDIVLWRPNENGTNGFSLINFSSLNGKNCFKYDIFW